jgi:hypothetical protein
MIASTTGAALLPSKVNEFIRTTSGVGAAAPTLVISFPARWVPASFWLVSTIACELVCEEGQTSQTVFDSMISNGDLIFFTPIAFQQFFQQIAGF